MPAHQTTLQNRFESLLFEHQRIVQHVARMYAGNTDERHDLAQEICGQLWRSFPGYDPQRRFSTWMYRIALNVGISYLRASTTRAQYLELVDASALETLGDAVPLNTPDQRLEQLHALIARFEPLDRALVLLYLEDRPCAEIAEVLGISQSNAATKIGRIKERLRAQIGGGNLSKEASHGTR